MPKSLSAKGLAKSTPWTGSCLGPVVRADTEVAVERHIGHRLLLRLDEDPGRRRVRPPARLLAMELTLQAIGNLEDAIRWLGHETAEARRLRALREDLLAFLDRSARGR